jgi:hypothetical protein
MYENHSPKLWLNFVHFFELQKVDIHFSWFFHITVSSRVNRVNFDNIYYNLCIRAGKKAQKNGRKDYDVTFIS